MLYFHNLIELEIDICKVETFLFYKFQATLNFWVNFVYRQNFVAHTFFLELLLNISGLKMSYKQLKQKY